MVSRSDLIDGKFEVLMAVKISLFVFEFMTPCGLCGSSKRFRCTYCLYLQCYLKTETVLYPNVDIPRNPHGVVTLKSDIDKCQDFRPVLIQTEVISLLQLCV